MTKEFFDNAFDTVKEAFDIACQKTGEVVSIEKLKYKVSSLKSKRDKDFIQLGKLYFALLQDDAESDDKAKALVDAINEKEEMISALEEKINLLKNKCVCPECGAAVDKKSVFCNICGKKIKF